MVPTLFGVIALVFMLIRVLPGDPIGTILGPTASPDGGGGRPGPLRARPAPPRPVLDLPPRPGLRRLRHVDPVGSAGARRDARSARPDAGARAAQRRDRPVRRPRLRDLVGVAGEPAHRPRDPRDQPRRELGARLLGRAAADPGLLRRARVGSGAERAGRQRRRPRGHHRVGDHRLHRDRQHGGAAVGARPPGAAGGDPRDRHHRAAAAQRAGIGARGARLGRLRRGRGPRHAARGGSCRRTSFDRRSCGSPRWRRWSSGSRSGRWC